MAIASSQPMGMHRIRLLPPFLILLVGTIDHKAICGRWYDPTDSMDHWLSDFYHALKPFNSPGLHAGRLVALIWLLQKTATCFPAAIEIEQSLSNGRLMCMVSTLYSARAATSFLQKLVIYSVASVEPLAHASTDMDLG
jgi:hypothetical protein